VAVETGFWYRFSLKIVPFLYLLVSRLLFATCRVREYRRDCFERCTADQPGIVAFWHYGILYNIHRSFTDRKAGYDWIAMVSGSRDAEYVAGVLRKMGHEVVRGSKGKGGLAALKKMIAAIRRGRHAAIVADGSQGPARKLQAGVILLAGKSGAPILPVAWSADRYFTFGSWDRTVLPKPFARIHMFYGEPLRIPAELKAADLESYRLELEKRLNSLYDEAWGRIGRKEH